MNILKDKNILIVGEDVSTATTNMDEVKPLPVGHRIRVEDYAELRLTDEEVSRIVLKQS